MDVSWHRKSQHLEKMASCSCSYISASLKMRRSKRPCFRSTIPRTSVATIAPPAGLWSTHFTEGPKIPHQSSLRHHPPVPPRSKSTPSQHHAPTQTALLPSFPPPPVIPAESLPPCRRGREPTKPAPTTQVTSPENQGHPPRHSRPLPSFPPSPSFPRGREPTKPAPTTQVTSPENQGHPPRHSGITPPRHSGGGLPRIQTAPNHSRFPSWSGNRS